MKLLIRSCYHFQTHALGKVMVTKAVVAYGPSDACCGPGLLRAGVEMADSQN